MNLAMLNSFLSYPKEKRLLKSQEYQRVFGQGKKIVCQNVIIFWYKNQKSVARLGLAISRRSVRRAVTRNRIKRIVRESFRQQQDFPLVDIVVIARRQLANVDRKEICQQVDQAWKKIIRYHSEYS